MDDFHRSVMCEEIVIALSPRPQGTYVDATLGGGGHAEALLKAGAGKLTALDMDGEALAHAGQKLACFAERLLLHNNNFRDLREVLEKDGVDGIDGAVFDLGLSWHQVRSEERGFSYQGEGVLDMRFDPSSDTPKALDLIRSEPSERLERILKEYGEERRSRTIAKAIVERRREIRTTRDLVKLLDSLVGAKELRKTAMRVFQALRIAVNDELENLKTGLQAAMEYLVPGGRVAVLAYHSLEDRIVKNIFRDAELEGGYRRVNPKPILPSQEEVRANPAARSAKLRILEKL